MSSTLTTAQLLALTRSPSPPPPPPGFVEVPPGRLVLPASQYQARIAYQAFFNPATNDLVISGMPKPQMLVQPGQAPEDGKDLGIFHDSPRSPTGEFSTSAVPVIQTQTLVERLTNGDNGDYPNATVSFAAEGAVGLAFSAASYELRNSSSISANVGHTITLNAWTGHWTPDGSVDAGVLDVRTPHPANGDPGIGSLHVGPEPWRPGSIVAAVNTGNAPLAGGLADIAAASPAAVSTRGDICRMAMLQPRALSRERNKCER